MIGTVDRQERAQQFLGYLQTIGINGEVRECRPAWSVWVYSEDDLQRAQGEFMSYLKSPNAPQFDPPLRIPGIRKAPSSASPALPMPRSAASAPESMSIPVTGILILLSVLVTVGASLKNGLWITSHLKCALPGLARGELWRLVTPIFLHASIFAPMGMGILHILFNMLWLGHLGSMIEGIKGRWFFLVLVVVIAAVSNLAQTIFQGPNFGGMSGVVYGLFGYVWMKMRWAPEPGLGLDSTNVAMLLAWFVICLFSLAGVVANWAHGMGLLTGMLFGIGSALWRRRR